MATGSDAVPAQLFVARQPLFTPRIDVYGYELLFRSGRQNAFTAADGDQASAELIAGGVLTMGLEQLTDGKPAFINFTRRLLVEEYYRVLPPGRTVVELLEDVEPDDEVVEACRRLKDAGYRLALDDVVTLNGYEALMEFVDFVKVDFRLTTHGQRRQLVRAVKPMRAKLVAEKVETKEEFEQAARLGFDYFQGYFLRRPTVITGREVPPFKLNLIHLLHAVHKPDFDFAEVEQIVKHDIALSYKILRLVNSVALGVRYPIESIRHALSMLGQQEVVRIISLMALSGMGCDRPQELAVSSIVRAKFMESVAPAANLSDRALDLFLVGLFSQLDAILDLPMAEVVAQLHTSEEVNAALLAEPGDLRDVLELFLAYEDAEWRWALTLADQLGIPQAEVPARYLEAVVEADEVFRITAGSGEMSAA